ncbi:MAG: sulfotransferase [Lysobacterales bacterium]|jgi:tetratricopeptide (TPR) repeat protein
MNNPNLQKLQKLLANNDLRGAEGFCRKAIQRDRKDVKMIALLGSILVKTGRPEEAERLLRKAIAMAPSFAKPYDDLGALYIRQNQFQLAEQMFRKAMHLSPGLKSSWVGLALSLKNQHELDEARKICEQILARQPEEPYVMRLLAQVLEEQGHAVEAGRLFKAVYDRAPNSAKVVADLARFHANQFAYEQAINLYRRATELEPGNPLYQFSLGKNLLVVGFAHEALEAYDRGLALNPDSLYAQAARLNALRALGRTGEVIAGYRKLIDRGVDVARSWWGLSSLRTHSFSDEDIERMTALRESLDPAAIDRSFVDFALGKAMDDRKRYDEAWRFYLAGNATRRKFVGYDSARFKSRIDAIIEGVDKNLLQRGESVPAREVTPIFILGMPRSGSTLIEQILASHSEVEATLELPYMQGLGKLHMFSETDRLPITDLDADRLQAIGDQYLRAVELHRVESKPFFIDKLPDNFAYIGLIAMALPGAKIIDARRNPIDTCVGNFRQSFGRGKDFAYDLHDLASHCIQYRRVMAHWERVLPGKVLTVQYESLVEDTEAEIRRILAHCGLPWQQACLDFHKSGREVTTASAEQVRQPIYKSAMGFWKHYERHLDELIEALAPIL